MFQEPLPCILIGGYGGAIELQGALGGGLPVRGAEEPLDYLGPEP